jgi:hypothetical protein
MSTPLHCRALLRAAFLLGRAVLLASSIVPLAVPAAAQTVLAEYGFPGPYGPVGTRVGLAGDVDGDGVNDLLGAGAIGVFTYSGATGAQLHYVNAQFGLSPTSNELLAVAGLDDADGDGLRDIVVAEGDSVRAYSRGTGALLWSFAASAGGSVGWRFGVLGDVDGDGTDDVAAGEPSADPAGLSSAGRIVVLSGATGAVLKVHAGTFSSQNFGRSMAPFADLDGDGRRDIVVGDSRHEVGGVTMGRIQVLSALSGAVLLEIGNGVPTPNFAIEVADATDLDGDGVSDIASRSVYGSSGDLEVWSGATGELLWRSANLNGFRIVAVGDANGDGVSELVAAGPGYLISPGSGQVYDGASGALLKNLSGDSPGSFLSLAAPGDTDGDGLPELLAGTGGSSSTTIAANIDLLRMPAGNQVLTVSNPTGGTGLGRTLDHAGDFDGDGRSDFALLSSAEIAVFAADDGALLRHITLAESGTPLLPIATAVAGPGDVNGDGVPDLALGEGGFAGFPGPGNGRVRLFSGADGAQLAELVGPNDSMLGEWVVDVADRNGDGVRDLLVSLREVDVSGVVDAGAVWLLSGSTLEMLLAYQAELDTGRRFGYAVHSVGDIDGDGTEDFVAGSRNTGKVPLFNTPAIYVISGASGQTLHKFTGDTSATIAFGAMIADATGDGVPDVLMTEPSYYLGGTGSVGRVRLYSGADGSLKWTRTGTQQFEQFGAQRAGVGDLNGDGYEDVGVAAYPSALGGVAHLLSGRDGSTLDTLDLMPGTALQAASFLPAGLVDEGGCADVLVGIPLLAGNGGARLYASSQGGIWGLVDLGHAKPGSNGRTPSLHAYGDLAANQPVTIAARDALPGATGGWMVGLSAAYLPFKQGILVPNPAGPFFSFPVAADAGGDFALTTNNPPGVFAGFEVVHQFWWVDAAVPGHLSASNGLRQVFK